MTTCDNCGSPVTPGDTFCGVCGTYLDWNSPTRAPATTSPAPATTPPDPAAALPDPADPPTAAASHRPADPPTAADSNTGPAAPISATTSTGPTPELSAAPVPTGHATTTGWTTGSPSPAPPSPDAAPTNAAPTDGSNSDKANSDEANGSRDDVAEPEASDQAPEQTARNSPGARSAEPGHDDPAGAEPETRSATDSDRRSRAAALVVPVSEAGPAAAVPVRDVAVDAPGRDRPGAVQPGRPVAPRPVLREFADERAGGQLACPHCGTANPPDRVFCRRCGRSLAGAVAQGKDRRGWRFRWPRGRGRLWRLLAFLLILALLVGAGWAAVHWGPRAVDAILDRLATAEATTPNATSASSSARNHGPELVADGLSNRYWSPTAGRGAGEWVELRFDVPIRVLDVIISGGVSPDQAEYLERGRPADVLVSTWTSAGVRTDNRFRLADRAGPQHFAVTAGDTTRLRVTIESGYALGPGRAPAIAEIEVFRRP